MDLTKDYDLAKLEQRRRMLGVTKPEIARRSGLSATVVYKVLERKTGSAQTVIKIASALGLTAADVVRDPDSQLEQTA